MNFGKLMHLHAREDFIDLLAVVSRDEGVDPALVEKDYWIMHALWGLQQQGFRFELKGGTSLSKGHRLIHRFSEDIDILIHPESGSVPIGKNQDKPSHIKTRARFFDDLSANIHIPGFDMVERDRTFDDRRMRSAGIRLTYASRYALPEGVKQGILLEAGFDQVAPNKPFLISSWAYERAVASGITGLTDNRAIDVPCYDAGYTLVEKLQTISTKYRRHIDTGSLPQNFLRHYYDIYCLLGDSGVKAFIGSDGYLAHKSARFRAADEPCIAKNPAFVLDDADVRERFARAYDATRALYYRGQPPFDAIIDRIKSHLAFL